MLAEGWEMSHYWVSQHWRSCRESRIEVQSPWVHVQEGAKTYDNQTEELQRSWELLIETGTTESWGYICYQDGGWRVCVTTVAVWMGVKEMGMWQGHRGTYNWSPNWEWEQVHTQPCRAIKEVSACNKMEIGCKERGLEPSGPRFADEVASVTWC